ncbi:MAG: hypothetical protein KF754_00080 [Planctomycetes bacterium]|nr:hypothetical protein [Planctomycetota bacterium]
MKRLVPILVLLLLAAAGCQSSQWTWSKQWGGGQPAQVLPEHGPQPKPEPEPKPEEQPQTPKDVIFVLGINGMD